MAARLACFSLVLRAELAARYEADATIRELARGPGRTGRRSSVIFCVLGSSCDASD